MLLKKDKKTEKIRLGLYNSFLYCILILFLTLVILVSKFSKLVYDLNPANLPNIVCDQQINFSSTNSDKLNTTGLSISEPDGRWSKGDVVRISFKMPKKNCRDSKITLRLIGFLYGNRQTQTSNVLFNGENIGEVNIKSGEKNPREIILDIPQNLTKSDELNTLVFHIKDPISPKSVGLNGDGRLLSFKFQTILFH